MANEWFFRITPLQVKLLAGEQKATEESIVNLGKKVGPGCKQNLAGL